MRIISGKFGGRRLIENKFEHIRPTADMVKQALFNMLEPYIRGAKVLDLCCGTGALGIEAISRGAREVVFVDKNFKSTGLTSQNLALIKSDAKVLKLDALVACKVLKDARFDIIIFDPPYKSDLYLKVPKAIVENGLLAKDAIFVVEHAKADEFSWPEELEIVDQRQYGIKQITFLKIKRP